MQESYPIKKNLCSQIEGAWQSVNGNPDIYIYQGYHGDYYMLAYAYDRNYSCGSFSCYNIDFDEESCFVYLGMKQCRLSIEKYPLSLHVAHWGSYIQN